jgi:Ca2+-binding RTX toxin-like protein
MARTAGLIAATIGAAAMLIGPLAAVATGSSNAAAQALEATPAKASANSTFGMLYRGGTGDNKITVTLTDQHFIVTDSVPIEAGENCVLVNPGVKPHTVSCRAFQVGGSVKPFEVRGQIGNDIITNLTAVPMQADGGKGNDVIEGGSGPDDLSDIAGGDVLRGNLGNDTLSTVTINADSLQDSLDGGGGRDILKGGPGPDVLLGGDGNNDQLDGGRGKDVLDGGPGVNDQVSYANRTSRIVASLDDQANDGEQNENDNVRPSVETLIGGSGSDVLSGNNNAQTLSGMAGDDRIVGFLGADRLEGGGDNDFLWGNSITGDPNDGAIDILDGAVGADQCRAGASDPDTTVSCETIDNT